MKNYNYTFQKRKDYEETFVENNNGLIHELTGAGPEFNLSQTPLDKTVGVDILKNKKFPELNEEDMPMI